MRLDLKNFQLAKTIDRQHLRKSNVPNFLKFMMENKTHQSNQSFNISLLTLRAGVVPWLHEAPPIES